MVEETKLLYEGKAKKVYETNDPNLLIIYFKDDATAFNGKKHEIIDEKGALNKAITTKVFQWLEECGIKTHFVEENSGREIVVKRLKMIPVEVVVRNIAAGSIAKRLGLKQGEKLPRPILEYYYKSDELDDPWINEDHITAFGWADEETLKKIREIAFKVNECLREKFDKAGIILVDFKLEFGFDNEGNLVLGDEFTPDGSRLWDKETGEVLDKDRFRRDLGDLIEGYEKILMKISRV
ncbi:phosphoribosylaminoimidazolesuccinocarboxamide synthase [Hippea alviniae]|uniref:phosphoribosylaminoimidazolesuccinocarboxamide synthase n=1 Tax=Hippea alviniae TaxID=1279027 RepID=UPI0003B433D9|nr:phosphoribosylaminoimidazolesuccinocarboxamide synthase [Hippea alviniae]